MKMPTKVEISHKTIIFTVAFLLAVLFIYYILDIIFLLFVSFVFMTALRPVVDTITRLRIPRVLAVIIVYLVLFGFFGVSLASTLPTVISQFGTLMEDLPKFVERLLPYWTFDIRSVTQQISPIGQSVVRVTVSIFSNIFSTLSVFGFTFYLLLERKDGEAFLIETLGEDLGGRILSVVSEIEHKLRWWVQGELVLMLFIGVVVYLGLLILKIDYAIPLAILAGFLEIIPLIGPIVSAIPAVLVAWGTNSYLAMPVIALYIIVQQVENNVIVPIVMKRSVGLSPLVTILALMIGNRFGGILGAILAVPFVLVIQVLLGLILGQPAKSVKIKE